MIKYTKCLENFKLSMLLSLVLHLSACSTIPLKPTMPRGPWLQMNTAILAEAKE